MTAKFKLPELVPSAEERARNFCRCEQYRLFKTQDLVTKAHNDGFLAGIDAVIALLREPDEDLQYRLDEVFWDLWVAAKTHNAELRHTTIAEAGVATGQFMPQLLRALADELEQRKP